MLARSTGKWRRYVKFQFVGININFRSLQHLQLESTVMRQTLEGRARSLIVHVFDNHPLQLYHVTCSKW
jgi:hypothetical protein